MNDSDEYIHNLEKLNFQIANTDALDSSVFLVNQLQSYIINKNISPYIIIALDKAFGFDADAVYFRFFDDARPPLAQIYIYDNQTKRQSPEYYADIHRKIWSCGEIPIFLIVEKTEIKVFDCRMPVKIEGDIKISKPIEIIDLDKVVQAYNAQNFNNGSFWENKDVKNNFKASRTASERLIKGLTEIREKIFAERILSRALADKILILCILIKYLEETGFDKETGKNLAVGFF